MQTGEKLGGKLVRHLITKDILGEKGADFYCLKRGVLKWEAGQKGTVTRYVTG